LLFNVYSNLLSINKPQLFSNLATQNFLTKYLNTIYKYIVFIGLFLFFYKSWSKENLPPSITAVGNQVYCPLSQIKVAESFTITDPDDTEVDAFYI